MISVEEFRQTLLGFNILDCVVRDRNAFYFAAQEDYTQWPTWQGGTPPDDDDLTQRIVPFIRVKPRGQQWSAGGLEGFSGILVGFSPVPKPQAVVTCSPGGVYATGSGASGMEAEVPTRGAVRNVKTIGGHLYVCGTARSVCRRDDKDTWFVHSNRIPESGAGADQGFEDIDGFSEDDLYAVGGAGDVWRFDGKRWQKCAFPTNLMLTSVCCAGDGSVYVGGLHGDVYRGRGDRWQRIHQDDMTLPFRDMVWYEDRVYCTSDYGVWTIHGDRLDEAPVDAEVKICAGNLSTRDGVLLLAGHGGAAFLENGRWNVIFHSGAMTEAAS